MENWKEYLNEDEEQRSLRAKPEPENLLNVIYKKFNGKWQRPIPYNGEETVKVYRGINPEASKTLRPGDWVSLTESYASEHGGEGSIVVSKEVPAEHVSWAGTDENEWFYTPAAPASDIAPEPLSESEKVTVFRAQPATTKIVRNGDYVTKSRKFAEEHAVTSAIYNGEDFHVVKADINSDELADADNPGEYKFTGDDKKSFPVLVSDADGNLRKPWQKMNEEEPYQKMAKKRFGKMMRLTVKGNNKYKVKGMKTIDPKVGKSAPALEE